MAMDASGVWDIPDTDKGEFLMADMPVKFVGRTEDQQNFSLGAMDLSEDSYKRYRVEGFFEHKPMTPADDSNSGGDFEVDATDSTTVNTANAVKATEDIYFMVYDTQSS